MENKDYLENICNMISEIARIAKELLCDIHKQISQSIIAIATITREILSEMPNITSNNFYELSRLLSAMPKDTRIFDDQYEKKLSSYRRRYKKPIKAFFSKHPIIREIIVGVLIDLIATSIMWAVQNNNENRVKEESLQIEYHSENRTYNMQIEKNTIDDGITITFPDDSTLILNVPQLIYEKEAFWIIPEG